jgi:hypothetical protein
VIRDGGRRAFSDSLEMNSLARFTLFIQTIAIQLYLRVQDYCELGPHLFVQIGRVNMMSQVVGYQRLGGGPSYVRSRLRTLGSSDRLQTHAGSATCRLPPSSPSNSLTYIMRRMCHTFTTRRFVDARSV